MKSLRPLCLALLAAALVAPLAAQPAKTPVLKIVEPARLAYINSGAFLDPATGIKQLVKAAQGLDLEFSNTKSELSLLQEKLRTLVGELQKLGADPVANAKAIADKQATGQQMQQELQAKGQAFQEAYGKRAQEVQGPIGADIGKELRNFGKERDLAMIFDIAKLGEAILDAKPELDLTGEFISYFNARHP
ncbi:MAG: OmpH family outer membrane protein [Lacunisphaera sp.]|nr:OmpH family outer membrane protein [Lacunisphaera sp.]